jgi:hypothetical protein
MCCSAKVHQSKRVSGPRYQSAIAWFAFEIVLGQRAQGQKLDLIRGLDQYILGLTGPAALRSQQPISKSVSRSGPGRLAAVFQTAYRLVDRERELAFKETNSTQG